MLEIDLTVLEEAGVSPERVEQFRAAVERAYKRADAEQPQLSLAQHGGRLHIVWLKLPQPARDHRMIVATFAGSQAALYATVAEDLEGRLYERFLEIARML